jgi:hypothetical protein
MKTPLDRKKPTIVSFMNMAPLIWELYVEFLKCGFSQEQAYGLIMLAIKSTTK